MSSLAPFPCPCEYFLFPKRTTPQNPNPGKYICSISFLGDLYASMEESETVTEGFKFCGEIITAFL